MRACLCVCVEGQFGQRAGATAGAEVCGARQERLHGVRQSPPMGSTGRTQLHKPSSFGPQDARCSGKPTLPDQVRLQTPPPTPTPHRGTVDTYT